MITLSVLYVPNMYFPSLLVFYFFMFPQCMALKKYGKIYH